MKPLLSVGLLRWSVLASVALSLIACFLLYEARDDKIPYGSQSFLSISSIDDHLSKTEAVDVIVQTVRRFEVNLTKVTVDPLSTDGDRLLIAFVGDTRSFEQTWPGGKYPTFSPSVQTRVSLPGELGTIDLRGAWTSDAPEAQISVVAQSLTDSGIATQVEQVSTTQVLAGMFGSPLMPALFGMLAALVVVTAYSITHRQKIFAIKILHGQGDARIFAHELASLIATFAASTVVLSAIGTVILGFVNHLHQAGAFLALVLQVLGVHAGLLAVILILAFVGSRTDDLVSILKGRRPLRNLAIFSVIAQSIAFVLVFVVASVTVQLVADTRSEREFSQLWTTAKDHVTISFSARTEDEFQTAMPRFGELVRQSDVAGKVVLAYQPPVPEGQTNGYGPYNGNSLIVNTQFLREQIVLDADGSRITPPDLSAHEILLVVPERLESQVDEIVTEYTEWAEFEGGLSGVTPAPHVSVSTTLSRNDQQVFNYGGTFARPQISQEDPVIAVIAIAPDIPSDSFLISAASTGNILFTDPDRLEVDLQAAGLESEVSSVDRAAEQALTHLAERDAELRAYLLVVLFAALVLLFSNAILASVYCDRFKQVLFQKFVHGYPFLRTHAAFLVGVLVWSTALVTGSMAIGGMIGDFAIPISATAVVANLACALAFALLFQRRFRGDFVKRY